MTRRRYSRPASQPVDLAVLRDVRRRLRELVEKYPELRCEPSEVNRAGWVADLPEILGGVDHGDEGEDEA